MDDLRIRDVMTSSVVTLKQSDTLKEAAVTFALDGISGAPVVDENGILVGILSETDILEYVKGFQERIQVKHPYITFLTVPFDELVDDKEFLKAYEEISNVKVGDIMTLAVVNVGPDANIMVAIEAMSKHQVNRIPVLEKGRLVGIVSRGDIIWSMYRNKRASD